MRCEEYCLFREKLVVNTLRLSNRLSLQKLTFPPNECKKFSLDTRIKALFDVQKCITWRTTTPNWRTILLTGEESDQFK